MNVNQKSCFVSLLKSAIMMNMKPTKVLIGSENRVKIESVRQSFSRFFDPLEIHGLSVDAGVSAQPVSNFGGAS